MKNFEWFGDKVMKAVESEIEKTNKKVADKLEDDAKRVLIRTVARTTAGGLRDQFSQTTMADGTVLVWCQGPRKWKEPYHASFVEMGTYKDEAQPFMRPAQKMNERPAQQLYKKVLNKI